MSVFPRARLRRALVSGAVCAGLAAGTLGLTQGGSRLPVALAVPRTDVFAAADRRPADGPGTTYLLAGLDSRSVLTKQQRRRLHVGNDACDCTDVLMLLHVSADGDRVSTVSLPRDSYVRFAYRTGHVQQSRAARPEAGKINSAHRLGGAALTVRTVEQATGVRVDHYLEADFATFVDAVNRIDGVTVCTAKPLHDANAGLDLPAGTHDLDGRHALQYVRARHIPPSGDLGRVRRQQRMLAELADTFADRGLLDDPAALARTAGDVLGTLRADEELTTGDLVALGRALRRSGSAGTEFATVPIADFDHAVPGWGSTLVWDAERAERLFAALREDRPLTDGEAYALPGPGTPVGWDPADIRVRVATASSRSEQAARLEQDLRAQGFDVRPPRYGTAGTPAPRRTRIVFAPGQERRAASLAAALPDARLRPTEGHPGVIEVRPGRDGARVVPVVHDRSSVEGAPATGDTLDCDHNG
ncbi:LCP family protein [Streptomyces sp. TR06-5]|uniref:LCP family protein n=1 Tax=Streptomyces sp. TR06-5 TaxID=3385976 RepID=UPI0039A21B55